MIPMYFDPSNASIEALETFGVKVRDVQRDPQFKFSRGRLWKSAGSVVLYDDGLISLALHSHLDARQRRIMYGVAATVFSDGVAYCKANGYTRLRKSKKRAVAGWWQFVWVQVGREDPLYDACVWAAYGDEPGAIESVDSNDDRLHQQTLEGLG